MDISYENLTHKKLPGSMVEIAGDVKLTTLLSYRAHALEHLGKEVRVDGFRPGHVPERVLVGRLGELAILEHAAREALADLYPTLLQKLELNPLGDPSIAITRLAPGNPLGFKMTLTVMPRVELPDYKRIAGEEMEKKMDTTLTEKEIEDVLASIKKSHATKREGEKEILPDLDLELVKKVGPFESVEDFMKVLRADLQKDKERKAKEARRTRMLERIITRATMELPTLLLEEELAKLIAQFKEDIVRMGMKLEGYLEHIKKTEEDLRREWRPDAEKRAKLLLILAEIAHLEKISYNKDELETEVKHLKEHYKGDVDEKRLRLYVATQMTRQGVIDFLESQK